MNSFQRTDKEQEQHEALFAARLAAFTASGPSRCSTPDSGSDCSITDDDEGAVGPYAAFNAAPSTISGVHHGGAPTTSTQEGPEGRSSMRSSSHYDEQPNCRCGQAVAVLPCGHTLCVLCCLRSRGGGQRHPSPSGVCVCAQLGAPTINYFMAH